MRAIFLMEDLERVLRLVSYQLINGSKGIEVYYWGLRFHASQNNHFAA